MKFEKEIWIPICLIILFTIFGIYTFSTKIYAEQKGDFIISMDDLNYTLLHCIDNETPTFCIDGRLLVELEEGVYGLKLGFTKQT